MLTVWPGHLLDAMRDMGMPFAVAMQPGRKLEVHQAQLAGVA